MQFEEKTIFYNKKKFYVKKLDTGRRNNVNNKTI